VDAAVLSPVVAVDYPPHSDVIAVVTATNRLPVHYVASIKLEHFHPVRIPRPWAFDN
jgi:hypothetical protein